jgi:hypothetical protein
MKDVEQLSPGWKYGVIVTFVFGFAVLILLTFTASRESPYVGRLTYPCWYSRS